MEKSLVKNSELIKNGKHCLTTSQRNEELKNYHLEKGYYCQTIGQQEIDYLIVSCVEPKNERISLDN